MCDAVIESMLQCSFLLQFVEINLFYLNSLPFTVSVITVLLISDLGVICLLEKC